MSISLIYFSCTLGFTKPALKPYHLATVNELLFKVLAEFTYERTMVSKNYTTVNQEF